jgi:hypothetical protein
MRPNLKPIIIILFAINLAGCGYTTRALISADIKSIYIEPFKNKIDFTSEYSEYSRLRSYYPLLESDITNAIVDRFKFDGNLKIARRNEADVILEGDLVEYRRDATRYTDNDDVEEYRISIVVDIKLWSTDKQEYLWQESHFVGDTTYFVRGSQATTESAAVKKAVTDLARRIVERTIEDW